jgi:hypothetical protein
MLVAVQNHVRKNQNTNKFSLILPYINYSMALVRIEHTQNHTGAQSIQASPVVWYDQSVFNKGNSGLDKIDLAIALCLPKNTSVIFIIGHYSQVTYSLFIVFLHHK